MNSTLIDSDVPSVIYHYTSMDALVKIVEGRSLHATSILYLNDVKERGHFLDLARARLGQEIEGLTSENRSELLQAIIRIRERATDIAALPFVTSFSRGGDLLPQWRAYAKGGNGVCIGFNTQTLTGLQLDPLPADPQDFWGDVQSVDYIAEGETGRLDQLLRDAMSFASQFADRQSLWRIFVESKLSTTASSAKVPSFSSEQECRLLFNGVHPYPNGTVHFKPTSSSLVPYMKLRFPPIYEFDSADPNQPREHFINKIVIAPGSYQDLTTRAVESFFQSRGWSVEVEPSGVPFRDW